MAVNVHLLEEDAAISALLAEARSIAVLGARGDAHRDRPAYYVPKYLKEAGYRLYPVPVHEPRPLEILDFPCEKGLEDLPPVDIVNVFRRAEGIPAHMDALLALRPRAVWLQLGIRNDEAAGRLAHAGIDVVQDRCIMVEHRRLLAPAG
jgi:hypothetical protein